MSEAFRVLLGSPNDPTDAVTMRLAHGSDSIAAVSALYRDVSRAHEVCAAQIREAVTKFKHNINDQEQDPSFEAIRALFLESTSYLGVIAKVQEQMANAFVKKICQPLDDLQAQYVAVKSDICGPDLLSQGSGALKQKSRALAKVRVADEETALAQNSLEQLKRRFGDEIKPALLRKAEERLIRADSMKKQAEAELRDLGSVEQPPEKAMKSGRGLTAETVVGLEKAETSRVLRTLDCTRLAVRLYFTYIDTIASPLTTLSNACDAYSPQYDIGLWLSRITGPGLGPPCQIKDDRKFALEDRNLAWLKGEPDGGGNGDAARLRSELARKEQELEDLHRELRGRGEQDFPKGDPANASERAAEAGSPRKGKQLEFALPESDSSGNKVTPPKASPAGGSPPNGVNNFLRKVATAITGRAPLSEENEEYEDVGDDSEEEWDGNPQDWAGGGEDEFRLSDYVPALRDRLRITLPEQSKFADRILEVQRRIEEYLWSLRNLNVDELARLETWESPEHVKPFDYEYGFGAYLCKFPKHTLFTAYATVHIPRALEWGSRYLPSYEWRLFSYETLILAEHISQKIIQLRELASLTERDVVTIGQSIAAAQAGAAPPMTSKRTGRHQGLTIESHLGPSASALASGEMASGGLHAVMNDAQAQGVQIMLHNSNCNKNLLRQWRVRLGLSAKENSFLITLLLPHAQGGDISHNPLDVRYRVHCLAMSWLAQEELLQEIKSQGGGTALTKILKNFVFRNLHFVRMSIMFKLQRFAQFLPQLSGIARWLTTWLTCQDWARLVQQCLPLPEERDDAFCHENLSKLLNAFKLMCIILSDLFNAHFANEWGRSYYSDSDEPVELTTYESRRHVSGVRSQSEGRSSTAEGFEGSAGNAGPGFGYKNPESFLRLSALMSCVETLDRSVRADLANEERETLSADASLPHLDETFTEDNPQALGGEEFNDFSRFDVFRVQSATKLDLYWQYELPVQHLVLTHACELISDGQRTNKMSADGIGIIQSVVILSHLLQHGMDPTTTSSEVRHSAVTTSLDTIRLYLVRGIWEELLRGARNSRGAAAAVADDDLLFNVEEATPPGEADATVSADEGELPTNLLISTEPLSMMSTLSTDFVTWLMAVGAPANLSDDVSVSETVTVRLLNCSLHNLFDALETPRGKFRNTSQAAAPGPSNALGDERRHQDHTDPDFGVLNYSLLDDVAHKPSFFLELDSVRREPEGVSLILPSRVERMVSELCLRRAATDTFRTQLFQSLCDYRRYYDTQSLPIALNLWQQVTDLMVLTPTIANPRPLDVTQLQSLVPLPLLLNGPVAVHDLYRHFISRSISAVFDRVFDDALTTLRDPTDAESWFLPRLSELDEEEEDQKMEIEKAWSGVISKFALASRKMIVELRTEIVHYAEIWATPLPGNQHAMIALYTIEGRFRTMLEELRKSPFWPEDTLPPSSSGITSGLSQFDKVVQEVRKGSRYENLLADSEPLSTPFSASIASALSKRLRLMEPLLARCVLDDWKPVDPPRVLYSTGAIDFFQFLHHILSAIWEYEASTEWVMPILLQFLVRVSRQYGERIRSTVAEARLVHMEKYAEQIIVNLTNPVPRVDVSLIGQLMGKHKKKGLKGLFGFGGSSKKKAQIDITNQLRDMKFNDDGSLVEDMLIGGSGPPSNGVDLGGGDSDGEQSPGPSNEVNPVEISEELKELANRIGPGLALQLYSINTALDPTGAGNVGVKTWLTRLHNLNYFQNEIGNLSMKMLQTATHPAGPVPAGGSEIMVALEKAGGRRVTAAIGVDREEDARLQVWQTQLVETVGQCRTAVNVKAIDVCKFCALRIVYFDLSDDLFEDVYQPKIATGHSLSNLVNALDNTVLKFVNATPPLYQECLLREIVLQLIKGWLVLVTELGYMGYQFGADDIDVLDNDMQALRQLFKRYQVKEEIEIAGNTVNIFSHVSDFISFLGSQPNTLAQLGGNYDKKKPEAPTNNTQPQVGGIGLTNGLAGPSNLLQGAEDDPEVKNMFAGLGTASPAFKAEEIVGKKKNKGVFKGALKLLKMK